MQSQHRLHRIPIASSAIASVAYSPDASLEVEFTHGALYRYFAVPQSVFNALLAAKSKGAYFSTSIRSCFPYVRLGP